VLGKSVPEPFADGTDFLYSSAQGRFNGALAGPHSFWYACAVKEFGLPRRRSRMRPRLFGHGP
jgi:hypothetical protein